jgi:hypothetical protein
VARKSTIGAELGLGSASGGGVAAGAFTRDTTVRRTGAASYKADGAGGLTATGQWNVAFALGVACFVRVYFRVDSIAAAAAVAVIRFGGSAYPTVRINPADRKVQLRDPSNNLIGSASSAALVLGKWHMLELSLTIGTGAVDAAEARLDGSSIASATAQTWSDTLPTNVIAGFITNPTSGVMYLDDIAINDATGTDQASWPGAGRVSILFPASISNQGAWTIGAGGSVAALANVPPQGEADSASSVKQYRSASATADTPLAVVTETYASKLPAGATITLVQPYADHAEGAATGTKNLDLAVTANPAGTTSAAFTAGGDSGAAGAWPTNWRGAFGPPVYAPSPTLGTGATVRVQDKTTNTNVVLVDQLVLIVETTGGGSTTDRTGSVVVDMATLASKARLSDRHGAIVVDAALHGSKARLADRRGAVVVDAKLSGSKARNADRTGAIVVDMQLSGSQSAEHAGQPPPPPPAEPTGAGGASFRSSIVKRAPALVDRTGLIRLPPPRLEARASVERAEPDPIEALLLAGVL